MLHFLEMIKEFRSFGMDLRCGPSNEEAGSKSHDLETWPLIQVGNHFELTVTLGIK